MRGTAPPALPRCRFKGGQNRPSAPGHRSLLSDRLPSLQGFLLVPQKPFQSLPFSPRPKLPNSNATFTGGRAAPSRCFIAAVTLNRIYVAPSRRSGRGAAATPGPPARVSPNFGHLDKSPVPSPKKQLPAQPGFIPLEKTPVPKHTQPQGHAQPLGHLHPGIGRGKEEEDGSPPRGTHPGRGWCCSPAESGAPFMQGGE